MPHKCLLLARWRSHTCTSLPEPVPEPVSALNRGGASSPTVVAQALGSRSRMDKLGKEGQKGHNTVGTEAAFVW